MIGLRWITYREPASSRTGEERPVQHHKVRAELVEEQPGGEGYEGPDVLGGDWPVVYRHWKNATPRPVRETWDIIDGEDNELKVVSVREVMIGLGPRKLEVRARRGAS